MGLFRPDCELAKPDPVFHHPSHVPGRSWLFPSQARAVFDTDRNMPKPSSILRALKPKMFCTGIRMHLLSISTWEDASCDLQPHLGVFFYEPLEHRQRFFYPSNSSCVPAALGSRRETGPVLRKRHKLDHRSILTFRQTFIFDVSTLGVRWVYRYRY